MADFREHIWKWGYDHHRTEEMEQGMSFFFVCLCEYVYVHMWKWGRDHHRTEEMEQGMYFFLSVCMYVFVSICVYVHMWKWGCVCGTERERE
jgi:hypothetical protein